MRASIQDVRQYHAEIIEGAHKALRVATAIMMFVLISQAALLSMRNSDSDGDNQTLFYSVLVIPSLPLLVGYLRYLFTPHSVGIQTGEDAVLSIRNQSSQFFMQLVKSRDSLNHIRRMTSEKIDDFIKQVAPYLSILFSAAMLLLITSRFTQETDKSVKQSIFLAPYVVMHAALIFGAVQNIRDSKSHEPRRKDCETQVDEVLLLRDCVSGNSL